MKKTSNILWGILLIVLGLIFAVNALGIADIDIFFDGWWTLFIIIPCAINLITGEEKTLSVIGLSIGVALLLHCLDIINFKVIGKLIVPALIIIAGVSLIFKDSFNKKTKEAIKNLEQNAYSPDNSYCSVFSEQTADYNGRLFTGAELTAVFGGVKCDLSNAVINGDVLINVNCIFGGVDIYLPENVNIRSNAVCIFGGTEDCRKIKCKDSSVTVYIKGCVLFGGVDFK